MLTSTAQMSPGEQRRVFGRNLRVLSAEYPSVSELCRTLGINRTQFNRYLSSESFPRPDVLDRMCRFFGVDARILLEPVETQRRANGLMTHPYIAAWLGPEATHVPEKFFPSGFYRFSRRSFMDDDLFLMGLVHVRREDGHTFLRGFEPREAMRQQGLPDTVQTREFRGVILRQDEGVTALISRRGGRTGSLNFLAPITSYEGNYWEGYVTRTAREGIVGRRATRMVYEHLGTGIGPALCTARVAGFCGAGDLLAHHLRLLRVDQPFG